ncbi:MAG: biotin synthase BioB [Candidatus Omnitrophota bacterium]
MEIEPKSEALLKMPLSELVSLADRVRQKGVGTKLDLCSIVNAKSGMCGEDCKFCAQSLHHSVNIPVYPLKETEEILEAARRAQDIGAERFGIVTSGNTLSRDELQKIADTVSEIRDRVKIDICASLGKVDEKDLRLLKEAGLSRYHHNVETSPGYFPRIVTTHAFQDRIDTIKSARKTGLQVCSGGIIGMGEGWEDRIAMAQLLKELDVDSIPINILVPIEGTLLENVNVISCADAIRTIAIFRILLPDKVIKLAAGRESLLRDFQGMAFMAGANGMLIGGYLTIKGREVCEDRQLIAEIKRVWQN